ncbi:MAG TPA: FecR domain-containing protein, partial [Rhodothermales bacterium]|nr:FecR domain-containing protein [Rhodothermales bacterium]
MNWDSQHNKPHTPPLPEEVWDALKPEREEEREEERAALAETWALAEHYRDLEPDEATFQQMGADIWATLEATIQEESAAEVAPAPLRLVKSRPRIFQLRPWHQVAMAACLALLIGVVFILSQQSITHTAPFGETATIDLPDGSQVILNSGSTLSHQRTFGEEIRRVTLEGEAFFSVAKSEIPFVVGTFNGTTTVVGTQFNVRAWKDDIEPATDVSVLEGKVRLAAQQTAQHAITLTAGESARLVAQSITPTPLEESVDNALAWRTGSFKLVKPLGTVARELE